MSSHLCPKYDPIIHFQCEFLNLFGSGYARLGDYVAIFQKNILPPEVFYGSDTKYAPGKYGYTG